MCAPRTDPAARLPRPPQGVAEPVAQIPETCPGTQQSEGEYQT